MEKDIISFHEKYSNNYDGPPRQLPADMQEFRNKFLKEELEEYLAAVERGDLEDQFDSLIDLVYVAMGTAYLQGFPFTQGWNEVHAANMRKVRAQSAADSKRGSQYDVVKPEGWIKPNIQLILDVQKELHEKTMD